MMNETNNIVPPAAVPPVLIQPVPEKRVWGGWATFGWGAVIIAAFFIAQTIAILVPLFVMAFSQLDTAGLQPDEIIQDFLDVMNANLGFLQSIGTIVSGIVGVGLILLIIKAKKGAGIKEYMGLNKIGWKAALLSVGLIIAYELIVSGIQMLLGNQSVDEQFLVSVYETAISKPLFWISVVIFAPLFEEAFFRGFVFEGFRQSKLGIWWTIIITAGAWAALHAFQYQIFNVAVIFVLGLMMGVMRWKTKTIWSTFIMHATMNLWAVIALELTVNA